MAHILAAIWWSLRNILYQGAGQDGSDISLKEKDNDAPEYTTQKPLKTVEKIKENSLFFINILESYFIIISIN